MLKYTIFIVTVFFVCIFQLHGQEKESISKDVKVVRAYSPTLSDAFKVNMMPELDDTSSFRPKFDYRILSKALVTDYNVEPISPAKLAREKQDRLKHSYLKAGIGNYNTIFADLNYNLLQSEPYVLGLNIGHLTSAGELTLESDEVVDAPLHDTWGNLNFKYLFDNKTLFTDLSFLHSIYNYYGFQNLDANGEYDIPGYDNSISSDLLQSDKKQRLAGVDFFIGIKNNEAKENKLKYNAAFGFQSFGNLSGVNQNGFSIVGNGFFPINELNFLLDVEIDHFKTAIPDSIGPMYFFNKRNNTLISATPKLEFVFERAKVNVGMLLVGQIDNEEDQFQIAPVISGELTVAEGIVSIFGGLDGHYNRNDYKTIVYENPFVSPDQNVKTAFYGLNLFAGIKGNLSATTSFSADMSYAYFDDEHFFMNKFYQVDGESELHYSNQFIAVHDDGNVLKVSGELVFHPTEQIELLARGTYYGWSLDSLDKAWHKPEMELNFRGRFSPAPNLFVDAGVNVLGQRFAFDPTIWEEKKLDSVFDLNLGAEYHFSSAWTFFAQINNLAASKYYKWNGYPMQGVNVRAGIGLSF